MARWLMILPPVLFAGLAGLFYFGMYRENPGELRSVLIGREAPALPATGLPEVPLLTDADLRSGEVTVVNFWATWCPPCQQETPDLRAAYEAHRNDGLELLAVSIQEPSDDVRDFVGRYGLQYRIGLDAGGAVAATYGVFGLPTHYFVDATGVIRDRYFGPLNRQQIEERLALIGVPPEEPAQPAG